MSCQFNHYRYLLDGKKTDTSDGIIKKYFLCHINDRLYYHVILKKTTAMFTREIRLGKIIVIPKFLVVSLLQKKKKKRKKRNPCCQVHLPLFSVTLTLNSHFPKTLSSQKHRLNSSKWPLVLLLLSLCVYLFPYITPSSTISHTLLSPSLIFASFELFRSFFQTNPFISNLNLTNFIKLRKFVVLDFLSWVDIFGLKNPLRLLKKKKKKNHFKCSHVQISLGKILNPSNLSSDSPLSLLPHPYTHVS